MSTPMLNAARIAISTPNSRNAITIDSIVKMVRTLRRSRFRQDQRKELHAAASWTSRPFSRCSVRLARAAACGSCVTMTMVLPCSRLSAGQQLEDLVARLAIEVAGRLVAQQQRRVGDDRAGDADPLFLSARQLARIVVGALAQPDHAQRHLHPPLAIGGSELGQQQRQLDVLAPRSAPAAGCTSERRSRCGARARPTACRPTACRCDPRRPESILPMACRGPPIRFSSVVLPEPDGPISARKSPSGMSSVTPWRTSIRSLPRW